MNSGNINHPHTFYRALQQVLSYHQQLGIDPYPTNDSLKHFLALQPEIPESVAGLQVPSPAKKEAVPSSTGEKAKEAASCIACPLHGRQQGVVWGRRLEEKDTPVRLLLVGDWLRKGSSTADLLFGSREDEMVRKMVAALGLPAAGVFVTNIVKCATVASEQITPECALRCAKYFQQQVAELTPQFICAMGPVAAKTILQTKQPLSCLRGRVHMQQIAGRHIPVVVTYHPFFLLQNEEMKRPAWEDLQLLGRRMGL